MPLPIVFPFLFLKGPIMAKRKAASKGSDHPKARDPRVWDKPSRSKIPQEHALSMSIQLSAITGPAIIQLRNGSSELQGTLILDVDGIRYKRPNQKKAPERKINWCTLGRLMDLGIITDHATD